MCCFARSRGPALRVVRLLGSFFQNLSRKWTLNSNSEFRIIMAQFYSEDLCSFKSDPAIVGTVEVSNLP